MKIMKISLTKGQLYKIREFVHKNGYPENCGKHFALMTQPVITEFLERLDIGLLNEKEFNKINKFFRTIKWKRIK